MARFYDQRGRARSGESFKIRASDSGGDCGTLQRTRHRAIGAAACSRRLPAQLWMTPIESDASSKRWQ